jgi:NAD(P)-dependent dehydrogenase (short-subunit alcohol dehydrogenase family)/acyl carrier protein
MSTVRQVTPVDDLTGSIRDVFAQVTRYPLEILDPEASLEEDLGIDSVKLGEVFSVLREKYNLPEAEEMDIPREKLSTISGISEALYEYLSSREAPMEAAQERTPEEPKEPAALAYIPSRSQEQSSIQDLTEESFAVVDQGRNHFTGKIAFISGSGRGIGKDIASYLAELGATVIVNSFHSRNRGIETVQEITAAGGDAIHLWGSVANPEHVDSIFDEIEDRYGYLDFFVSCASNGMLAKLNDTTVEHWEKAFRTNVVGLHQCALRAARLMKKNGGGKIITLSSPAAYGYVEYFGCMGAVKAAVDSLTKSMAVEFGPDNIQVNCVSPGPVYGELLSKWPESERLISHWEAATSYKRLCKPRDVSHFVAYLLSDTVKLFTGSVLVMDGGISARSF